MIVYTVKAGDCLSSIAARHGFTYQYLWDHPLNAELRAQRKDPNIIYVGDLVRIPELDPGEEVRPVDRAHRFQLTGDPHRIRIRLLFREHPRPGIPCTLNIDGREVQTTTDGDGRVEAVISPTAKNCRLTLHDPEGEEFYDIDLGLLDPVETVSGWQQRLTNLGYDCGPVDGIDGPLTKAGVRAFQSDQKIAVDGIVGPVTRGRLLAAHGS